MTKRNATAEGEEREGFEAAVEAQVEQPGESVTAKFRLVWLGGQPGDDAIAPRLVASVEPGPMVGEINLLVTGAKARRMFESGSGLFVVEIRPA